MEFPADWTVLLKDSFDLAVPRIEGPLTMELHAEQCKSRGLRPRPVGRLQVVDPQGKADFRPENTVIRWNLTTSA
jgi:hypothetical protein